MADTRITDAEIAGYMGWRGPGVYTEASLRKIREIIDHVLRAERATPPSPSTAPEHSQFVNRENAAAFKAPFNAVDERAAFERHERESNLRRVGVGHDGSGGWYENPCVQSAWEGWQARATLASRPAEVDDEGPPALPSPEFCAGDLEIGEPVYTAEQYRQGQRDAVSADRARRGDGWISLSDEKPEVGEVVLVSSEGWSAPRAMRYRVQPWESLLDAEQGRWFWHPERMLWKRFAAPSHTTNKENG